jgi:aldehyde dehydrogenase (NAD+)
MLRIMPKSILRKLLGSWQFLTPIKTEEEVIRKPNSTEYGLVVGVFTQHTNKALRVASEFDSGMVGINCVRLTFLTTPFGGSKQSGVGRECGKATNAESSNSSCFLGLTALNSYASAL